MSTVANVITDDHQGIYEILLDPDLAQLRDDALDATHDQAEMQVAYLADAIDMLARYPNLEPSADEVLQYLGKDDYGDWRRVTTLAAWLTAKARLTELVEEDIAALQAAVQEAQEADYEAVAIHGSCPYGHTPHARESSWATGRFYEWHGLDCNLDAYLVEVTLADGTVVWLELASNSATPIVTA